MDLKESNIFEICDVYLITCAESRIQAQSFSENFEINTGARVDFDVEAWSQRMISPEESPMNTLN